MGSPGGQNGLEWPILLKIGSLGGQIWGRRPPIEGLGGPDPRSGASDLAKMAKFGVPRQISPLGDRILVSKGGQNAVDLANFGQI